MRIRTLDLDQNTLAYQVYKEQVNNGLHGLETVGICEVLGIENVNDTLLNKKD